MAAWCPALARSRTTRSCGPLAADPLQQHRASRRCCRRRRRPPRRGSRARRPRGRSRSTSRGRTSSSLYIGDDDAQLGRHATSLRAGGLLAGRSWRARPDVARRVTGTSPTGRRDRPARGEGPPKYEFEGPSVTALPTGDQRPGCHGFGVLRATEVVGVPPRGERRPAGRTGSSRSPTHEPPANRLPRGHCDGGAGVGRALVLRCGCDQWSRWPAATSLAAPGASPQDPVRETRPGRSAVLRLARAPALAALRVSPSGHPMGARERFLVAGSGAPQRLSQKLSRPPVAHTPVHSRAGATAAFVHSPVDETRWTSRGSPPGPEAG